MNHFAAIKEHLKSIFISFIIYEAVKDGYLKYVFLGLLVMLHLGLYTSVYVTLQTF